MDGSRSSAPHMMQISADSASHPGVHQRRFASGLGGKAKDGADNRLRKGATARTLAHTAFPLSNPHRSIVLAAHKIHVPAGRRLRRSRPAFASVGPDAETHSYPTRCLNGAERILPLPSRRRSEHCGYALVEYCAMTAPQVGPDKSKLQRRSVFHRNRSSWHPLRDLEASLSSLDCPAQHGPFAKSVLMLRRARSAYFESSADWVRSPAFHEACDSREPRTGT